MTTAEKLYDAVNAFAPFSTAVEGDSVGLLIGAPDAPVERVAVALDATRETVMAALEAGCQLLLTHHPVYFGLFADQPADSPARLAAGEGLAVLCAHTCLDAAPGGVNDCLAAKLGMTGVAPLGIPGEPVPLARVGRLAAPSAEALAAYAGEKLGSAGVKFTSCKGPVTTVAVCGGSGGDYLLAAREAGAQALIVGESKHHHRLLARTLGIALIECGHFCTEWPVTDVLARLAEEAGAAVVRLPERDPAAYWRAPGR